MAHESKTGIVGILSADHLGSILQMTNIDTLTWGTGKAKSVQDLYGEIQEGETVLVSEGGELRRQVSVATVDVFYTDSSGKKLKLVEVKQVWHDGSGRERSRDMKQSVSEKLKVGENPLIAIVRGLQEELGINVPSEAIVALMPTESNELSPSYPGLQCQYKFSHFETSISEASFKPEGYVEDDGKKFTHFQWVQA